MEITGAPGQVLVNGDTVVLDLILGIQWIKKPAQGFAREVGPVSVTCSDKSVELGSMFC
jgi:hypothetical protein